MPGYTELMGDRMPFDREMPSNRTALDNNLRLGTLLTGARAQRLSPLGSIAIDRNRLQAQPPAFDIRLLDFFDRDSRRQVYRL